MAAILIDELGYTSNDSERINSSCRHKSRVGPVSCNYNVTLPGCHARLSMIVRKLNRNPDALQASKTGC